MEFSDHYLTRYQALYLQNFGEEISKERAAQKFEKLVRFVKVVTEARAKQRNLISNH